MCVCVCEEDQSSLLHCSIWRLATQRGLAGRFWLVLHLALTCVRVSLQYLEARSKGRVVSNPGRDSRQGLDVAYLSALTTAAKLAEEEMRIKNHFVTQTMSLKVVQLLKVALSICCILRNPLAWLGCACCKLLVDYIVVLPKSSCVFEVEEIRPYKNLKKMLERQPAGSHHACFPSLSCASSLVQQPFSRL